MVTKEENAKALCNYLIDIVEGRIDDEAMHNTGFIEMCGKTADDAIRQIREKERTNEDSNR